MCVFKASRCKDTKCVCLKEGASTVGLAFHPHGHLVECTWLVPPDRGGNGLPERLFARDGTAVCISVHTSHTCSPAPGSLTQVCTACTHGPDSQTAESASSPWASCLPRATSTPSFPVPGCCPSICLYFLSLEGVKVGE